MTAKTETAPLAGVRQRKRPPVQPVAEGPVDAAAFEVGTADDVTDNSDALLGSAPVLHNPMDDPKSEIAELMAKVAKRHGPETMFRASTRPTFRHVSSGSFALDMAMLGGLPAGLVTLYSGWQHQGKTTFADRGVATFQKATGMLAAKVDVEGTDDPLWAGKHGRDNDRCVLVQPTTGEDAADMVESLIRTRDIGIIELDSVAALVPLKEIEASTEDSVMGKYALLCSRLKRKIENALLDERKRGHWPVVILTNQYRMSMSQYGDPRVMPGGKSMPYLATYHYDFKSKEVIVDGKLSHGANGVDMGLASHNVHTFTKMKNKLGNGFKEVECTMIRNPYHPFGEGFLDEASYVLTEAKKRGFVFGSGPEGNKPPYRIEGLDEKFKSLAEMTAYMYSDLEFYEVLKNRCIEHLRASLGMSTIDWRYVP